MNYLRRIKRILDWLPILWKTHDWDHAFMTQIWVYSLTRLRDSMVNGHCVVTQGKLRKLNTAIFLLNRISNTEKYTDLDFDLLIRKYGPIGLPGLDDNPWPKEAIDELVKLHKKENYLFNQDVDALHKILKKHLLGWWD